MKFVVKSEKKETTYELPYVQYLPAKWQKEFAEINRYNSKNPAKLSAAIDLMLKILDEYCEGVTEIITTKQMDDLFNKWNEESEINMGE